MEVTPTSYLELINSFKGAAALRERATSQNKSTLGPLSRAAVRSPLPRDSSRLEVLASKRDDVSGAKRRYDDGLEKVISTEEQARANDPTKRAFRLTLRQCR